MLHALIDGMMDRFARIIDVLFFCAFAQTVLEDSVLKFSEGLFLKCGLHRLISIIILATTESLQSLPQSTHILAIDPVTFLIYHVHQLVG